MSDENRPRITQDYLRQNNLWSRTRQPIQQTCIPLTKGQSGRVWCGILSTRTLKTLAVMLLGQWTLISQHQIWHIVSQVKESWLAVGHCSVILSSRN